MWRIERLKRLKRLNRLKYRCNISSSGLVDMLPHSSHCVTVFATIEPDLSVPTLCSPAAYRNNCGGLSIRPTWKNITHVCANYHRVGIKFLNVNLSIQQSCCIVLIHAYLLDSTYLHFKFKIWNLHVEVKGSSLFTMLPWNRRISDGRSIVKLFAILMRQLARV